VNHVFAPARRRHSRRFHRETDERSEAPSRWPWRLRFPPHLEREFLAIYRKRGISLARFTVAVSVLLHWGVVVLDRGVLGNHLIELWPLVGIYGLALPMVTLHALLAFSAREGRYLFVLAPYIVTLNGVGLSIMLLTYGDGGSAGLPQTLILLNPVFAVLLSGMLLRYALPTAVFVFVFHLLGTVIIGYPVELLAGNTLVISGSVAMCLLGGWQIESWHRAAWLREREFQRMADRDQLTGLASRYYLFTHGEPLLRETLRDDRSVSVLMVDVDYFKAYNDRFGHAAGDRCLQRIAGVIREVVEVGNGIAARFGGEEFLVLLPDSGRDDALSTAESLRGRIAALEFDGEEIGGDVSVSIGVATAADREANLDLLIALADDALYRAKRDGRDRVIPAEDNAGLKAPPSKEGKRVSQEST
jgi:diguanylate cyclase (GGDEF)-like protein